MTTIEILTKVTENGDVVIPRTNIESIPVGSSIRVLILWEELTEFEQEQPGQNEESLSSLLARIRGRPLLPAYTPVTGKILAEDWLHPITEGEADFATDDWNRAWDEIESQIEAEEDADQEQTIHEIHNTLRDVQL